VNSFIIRTASSLQVVWSSLYTSCLIATWDLISNMICILTSSQSVFRLRWILSCRTWNLAQILATCKERM